MTSKTIIGRIFSNLRQTFVVASQKDVYVGRDYLGNRYFERHANAAKGLKRQRRVQPQDPDQWKVPEVPVEWMTWLQGRRDSPPADEEMETNMMDSLRTQHRANELQESRKMEDADRDAEKAQDIITPRSKVQFPTYGDMETDPGQHSSRKDKKT